MARARVARRSKIVFFRAEEKLERGARALAARRGVSLSEFLRAIVADRVLGPDPVEKAWAALRHDEAPR